LFGTAILVPREQDIQHHLMMIDDVGELEVSGCAVSLKNVIHD
jgi:hypothetical protein